MLTATLAMHREAEMTVERLVQEFGIDRAAVTVSATSDETSAGVEPAAPDNSGDRANQNGRDDAAPEGAILVSAHVADDDTADKVRAAYREFDADLRTEGGTKV